MKSKMDERINCKECGRISEKYRYWKYDRILKFCSRECSFKWHSDNPKIGIDSPFWLGDKASYSSKHHWIIKHYGKANICENDNSHSGPYEWSNISGEYKRDMNDYSKLCAKCHRRKDNSFSCRRGHIRTKENTYVVPKNGNRQCRICKIERKLNVRRK